MIIRYIAKRSLITGHTAGVQYELQFSTSKKDWKGDNIGPGGTTAKASVTLSGASSLLVSHFREIYSVSTLPLLIGSTELAAAQELFDSIRSGEQFEADFERDGNFIACKLDRSYKKNRFATVRHFIFSCEIRVL